MSLEGYKPLDLSALTLDPSRLAALNTPVDNKSIAQTILANTGWDSKDLGKITPTKNKTLISRVFDLLSIGNYGVANAADKALTAHESDPNDSFLNDIVKMDLQGKAGLAKGALAGIKGAFGTDEVANNPEDKTHFMDVLLRHTDKGKEALDPYSGMSDAERKRVTRGFAVSGLGLDIALDPLTYVGGLGLGGKAKNVAELPKVFEAAGDLDKINTVIKGEKNIAEAGDIAEKIPKSIGAGSEPISTHPVDITNPDEFYSFMRDNPMEPNPAWSKGPKFKQPKGEKGREDLFPPLPEVASRLEDTNRRQKIAGSILQDVIRNSAGKNLDSAYVLTKLNKTFPGMEFAQTQKYLDQMAQHGENLIKDLSKNPNSRKNFTGALNRVLEADFHANRAAVEGRKVKGAIRPDINTLKASDIIERVALGDKAAAEIAAPVESAKIAAKSAVKADDPLVAQMVKKYQGQVETGLFPGMKNPEHVRQAIANGKTVRWSGPKQVNMWNSILKRIPYSGLKKYNRALGVLRATEDAFIGMGHKPFSAARSAEALEMRLSDVIAKVGPEAFARNPEYATTLLRSIMAGGEMSADAKKAAQAAPELKAAFDDAMEATRAGSAITEAAPVQVGVDAGARIATGIVNSAGSAARIDDAVNIASKVADDIARQAGAATNTAGKIVKAMFLKTDPVESAIKNSKFQTLQALSTGNLAKYNNASRITKAIATTIDSPAPSVLGRQVGPAARTLDWLGARFNTAYKNADMRPIYLQEAATARASVAKRAHVWNDAVRKFGKDKELWQRAYAAAQGLYHPLQGTPEAEISKLILQNIENLVGSSGLKKMASLENSVAGRAQLTMNELNENLRRFGITEEFTNAKVVKDAMGSTVDYSKGADWLHSWQSWNIKDPLQFMMRMQNAVEHTVRESNMYAEMAARWGVSGPRRAKGYTASVAHPRLAGVRFKPEIADQIRTFMKNLDDVKKPNSKQMQLFDHVLSKWKASVTIYMPSHHLRNLMGDMYFNWLAGVNDVSSYSKAMKVMSAQSGRYSEISTVGNLTNPKALMQAMERLEQGIPVEKGTNISFTMRNGQRVTNDMVYTAMYQKGLLPSARILEDIPDDAMVLDKFRPFNGRVQAGAHSAAEYREHLIRIAHFINDVKKSRKPFAEAINEAASAVRKWHPDGMDLTKFERNGMRRVFPFYSWTRKAYPLVIESLLMKPGKVSLYPKAQGALQSVIMGQNVNWADPFPEDQLFPDWIKEKGIGPIMGSSGNYGIINPSNPTLDLTAQASDPVKGIGQLLNPAARIPAELITGTEASTGAPINSYGDYATKQLPGISTVGRVTNVGLGGPTSKFESQGMNEDALLNLILAAGKLNTGPYQKQAEFDLRDYIKNRG